MQESIIFSPDIDDRALKKETQKVNNSLQDAGTITPEIDDSQLDGMRPGGVGSGISNQREGGGVGLGGSGAAGAGALASKLPKPIAGVSVSAALPVALGGAVGAGMLSAMHSASARMQTSTNMLGQAWNNVWRPIGDRVDELFIRDPVMSILRATEDFEDLFRSSSWLVDPLLRGMGDLLTLDFAGLQLQFSEIMVRGVKRMGVPDFSWPDVGSPDLPDWNSLSPGVPDWSVLSPSMPDWTGLNLNLPDWLTRWVDGSSGESPGNDDPGVSQPPSQGDSSSGGRSGGGGGGRPRRMASGGVVRGETTATVGEAGPEVVQPLSEYERVLRSAVRSAIEQSGGGGDVDLSRVEGKLDDVNRNLKRLSQAITNMGINVDGERFGRLASNSQQERVMNTDPIV